MKEIFPFDLKFGELSREDLNAYHIHHVSIYTASYEFRQGKRRHLLVIPPVTQPAQVVARPPLAIVPPVQAISHTSLPVTPPVEPISQLSPNLPVIMVPTPAATPTPPTITTTAPAWTSLFKSAPQVPTPPHVAQQQPVQQPVKKSPRLETKIAQQQPELIIPRGLINQGNMCFMHSILQSLLHCSSLFSLLSSTIADPSRTPLLHAMLVFFSQFSVQSASAASATQLDVGSPFLPQNVHLKFKSIQGRQEDAQEFLGHLLDTLHTEFLLSGPSQSTSSTVNGASNDDDQEWTVVSSGHHRAATKKLHTQASSPISRIFGGLLCSTLSQPGHKDSLTIEPFNTLPIDISDGVTSVSEALYNLTRPETIYGYSSPPSTVTKQILFESLPPVLVLHLKRFVYSDGQTLKLHNYISYPLRLDIPSSIMTKHATPQSYSLFSVVYHHGKGATDGHYTANTRRSNGSWLNFDDVLITSVSQEDVLSDPVSTSVGGSGCAYLLFYQRDDRPQRNGDSI